MHMQQLDGITSHYLRAGFSRKIVKKTVSCFKKVVKDNVFGNFDAIVVRGVSGLLFGQTLAYVTDKNLLVIRKPGEGSHSDYEIEGFTEIKRYIIVDDFINSGKTMGIIVKETKRVVSYLNSGTINPELAGCFLWCTLGQSPSRAIKEHRMDGYYTYSEWESIPLVCSMQDGTYNIEYAYNAD